MESHAHGARPSLAQSRLSALRRPSRAALTHAALGLLTASGAVVALGLSASKPPLAPFNEPDRPDWLGGPIADLGPRLGDLSFVVLLGLMLVLYVVVVANARLLSVRASLAAVLALHVVFAVAPPLVQTDIFGYLMYGRLGVLHDLVPYLHVANDAPDDPIRRYVGWKHFPSPYGPVFTLATYPLVWLPVPLAIWVLKASAAAASLGCVALTWSTARRLQRPALAAAVFVGLNPLLLVWGVGAAHNDLFMLLLMLIGVRLAVAGSEAAGAATVVLAGAVKSTSGLVLPFLVAGTAHRGRALAGAATAVLLLGAVSIAAFGVRGVGGMVATVLDQGALISGHSVPNDLFRAFGANGLPRPLRPLFAGLLLVIVVLLLRRTWRGADWVTSAGWATLALLCTVTFLMPWYVVWLLPLAALAEGPGLRWATLAMTGFLVVGRAIVLLS
jgi:hypothetical protein